MGSTLSTEAAGTLVQHAGLPQPTLADVRGGPPASVSHAEATLGSGNETRKVRSEAYDKEQHRLRRQRQRRSTDRLNAVPLRFTSDDVATFGSHGRSHGLYQGVG